MISVLIKGETIVFHESQQDLIIRLRKSSIFNMDNPETIHFLCEKLKSLKNFFSFAFFIITIEILVNQQKIPQPRKQAIP